MPTHAKASVDSPAEEELTEGAEGAEGAGPASTMRTDTRERGAASAELAGIMMVIVLLISALMIAAGSGGLGAQYENLLCRAFSWFGTTCSTPPPLASEREPDEACTVDTRSKSKSIGVTVVADVDGGGTVTFETMSDGTYRVSANGVASAGMGIGAGGGLGVTVDGDVYGANVVAGGGASLAFGAGASWTFDNIDDANRLFDYLDKKAFNATSGTFGLAKEIYETVTGDNYSPPAPGEYAVSGGLVVSGNAAATGLRESATAEASITQELGATFNTETSAKTIYFLTTLKGSADLRLGSGPAGTTGSTGASGEVSGVLAVTVSPNGEYLTNVSFEATAYGEAGYQVSEMFGSAIDGGDSGGTVLNASVDLTDTESSLIAADLLRAAGIETSPSQYQHQPKSGGGAGQVPALSALQRMIDVSRERGEVYRQAIEGESSTAFAINGSANLLGGVGLRYDNSSSKREVTDAQYFDGSRWVDWTSCKK